MKRPWLIGSILILNGCGGGGESTGPGVSEGFGLVEVTLARAANGPALMFSGSVQVANRPSVHLINGQVDTISNVPAGSQTVEGSSLTANCTLQGQNPRNISVTADQMTRVTLEVNCSFDGLPRIVFLRRTFPWDYNAWTVSPDGTGLTQITSDNQTLTPGWSPDGTRIVFTRGTEIWVMNYDGTEKRLLATNAGLPAWSPDGERILFSRQLTNAGPINIWGMDADGANEGAISQGTTREQMGAWSHDGQKIAFCSGGNVLAVMDSDGNNPMALTEEIGCSYPVWAPDDQEILFNGGSLLHGLPQVYRIGADGSLLTRLTDISAGSAAPSYTPDGTAILFNDHGTENGESERAWIIDVNGDNPRHFDPIPWEAVSFLRWWGPS